MPNQRIDLGPVSAYAIAKANGYEGTEEQFVTEITTAAENAQAIAADKLVTEGYSIGKQNGTDVSSGEYFENNAKYYSELAAYSASVAGYMNLYIDENGYLVYEHTRNLDNIDFELDDGKLVVVWP